MKRRQLLTTTAALALAVPAASSFAAGEHTQPYTGYADYQQALADGKPFMLDFYASWWGTCRAQDRTVSALLDSNPAYQQVKILRVDWDQFSRDQIVQELNVARRSTLVMFNQGQEVGRVVAQTDRAAIEALFKAVM